jgi:integrase/recombinase XerD
VSGQLARPPQATAATATGKELVADYVATLQSEHSRGAVVDSLRRIAKVLAVQIPAIESWEDVPWGELDWRAFQLIRQRLSETYPPATANVTLSTLRGLYRTAYHQGRVPLALYLASKDTKQVRGSRIEAGRSLSPDELRDLVRAAEAMPGDRGVMLQALVAVMAGLGLRREEAAELRLEDVRSGELRLVGKGNKERAAPMDESVEERVQRWLRIRAGMTLSHSAFFIARSGQPASVNAIWAWVGKLGKAAQIAHFSPHDLRRTFATRILDAGLDHGQLCRLMGHANIATTIRYDRRGDRALAERRRALRVF